MKGNREHWDKEYKKPKLITKSSKPQKDFLRLLQWMKKNKHMDLRSGIRVLDIGTGVGKNAYYLADTYNASVYAIDFSKEAISLAKNNFFHENISYMLGDISDKIPLEDESVDLIIDVMSSHALSEKERTRYLQEISRVLRKGGYIYLRTFAREGDKNAQALIKKFPGPEEHQYIHPDLGLKEKVFTGPEIKELYGKHFRVVRMERKTSYQRFGKQAYKRNYWNVYLTKE